MIYRTQRVRTHIAKEVSTQVCQNHQDQQGNKEKQLQKSKMKADRPPHRNNYKGIRASQVTLRVHKYQRHLRSLLQAVV